MYYNVRFKYVTTSYMCCAKIDTEFIPMEQSRTPLKSTREIDTQCYDIVQQAIRGPYVESAQRTILACELYRPRSKFGIQRN